MFKMRRFFLIVVSPISALSIAHAADYTPTASDSSATYVVTNAPEACKQAGFVVDKALVGPLADKSKIVQALDGVKGSAGPDGAMQDGGLCKAQVFSTAKAVFVYQSEKKQPYDKFWMPYDFRPSPRASAPPPPQAVKCLVPKDTVVVIGTRRNPYSPREEYVTQWYIGDTHGTVTRKSAPPLSWKCETSQ
jgi:hypothetical protein